MLIVMTIDIDMTMDILKNLMFELLHCPLDSAVTQTLSF